MANEPGKLTGEERVRKDEPVPSQFATKKGGEDEETYEQLLDQYGARKFAQGDVMKGTVLKITDTDVIVDIGYKSEGIIPVNQFMEPNGVLAVAVGELDRADHLGCTLPLALPVDLDLNVGPGYRVGLLHVELAGL